MADSFLNLDAQRLLDGKSILLIGDSNMRAIYKDLVCLLVKGSLLCQSHLRAKGEPSFLGDTRKNFSGLRSSRDYVEDRFFTLEQESCNVDVEFVFTTTVNCKRIRRRISAVRNLDVLIINSTLWDLTRWGPDGDIKFQEDLVKLLDFLKNTLPASTLVIWLTALHPSSKDTHSALIVKELDFIKKFIQFNLLEANVFAAGKFKSYGFNVLDLHYYTRLLCHRRRPDGVHYSVTVVRYNTNSILTHIALSWQVQLPGRVERADLRRIQETIASQCSCDKEEGQPMEAQSSSSNSEIAQRKILRPKRRLRDEDQLVNDLVAKSAIDFIQENNLVIGDLNLQGVFGPDY